MTKEAVPEHVEPSLSAPQPELREAAFMIPLEHVDANAVELHKQIMFQIASRFGGCYSVPVFGAWRNDSLSSETGMAMIQVEGMLKIISAIGEADESDFRDFALASARVFKQEALYWVSRDGASHVVPVTSGRLN